MIVALLILIILVLLFGAGAVKGWIRGVLFWMIGAVLAAAIIVWIISNFGEDAFLWLVFGVGGILLVGSIWARSFDPTEAEHKERIKNAKKARDERRANGIRWP